MKIIKKFVATSPMGSDCTTAYDVILYRTCTVHELLTEIAHRGEWGKVTIGGRSYSYQWSHFDKVPDEILELQVEDVKVAGGWSRMDYVIKTRSLGDNDNLAEQKRRIIELLPSLDSMIVMGRGNLGPNDFTILTAGYISSTELLNMILRLMHRSPEFADVIVKGVLEFIRLQRDK